MARVTVEDCIDKVENRFDLVLLASHRARMVSSGAQIAVERDNDKNPVVALREIAEKAISPEDLREELVHSLQKYVEVDEPEPVAVPLIGAPGTGVDADDTDVTTDRMSEEELLKGLDLAVPFMVSGGLDVGNVEEALRISRADGLDVSSGVENAPGEKDADMIRAFVKAARARGRVHNSIPIVVRPARQTDEDVWRRRNALCL